MNLGSLLSVRSINARDGVVLKVWELGGTDLNHERMQGSIRERDKVLRALKNRDENQMIDGFRI